MDSQGEAVRGHRGDRVFHLVVDLSELTPPVHHQEHLAVTVGCPVAPAGFPAARQRFQLRHGPPYQLDVPAPRDHPGVREVLQRGQHAAAEVQAVELDIGGAVRGGQPQQQGAQCAGLARPCRTDHGDVTTGAVQVDGERVTTLGEGVVHQPDRRGQSGVIVPGQQV